MTRSRLVLGNWKMNPATIADAVALARAAVAAVPPGDVAVAVAPPVVALASVAEALRGSNISVYAQDVHWEDGGAYTGQISASMLAGVAAGTIVGHSEVRRDLGDDDVRVARKLARAIAAGLRVVLCVGESEAQHLAGDAEAVVARQVAADVAPLRADRERATQLVIAYEPIWAIGTGHAATAAHASAAARVIRRSLEAGGLSGDRTPVLYGGSVTAANAREFATAEGIDGALVGGASLKADEFGAIVQAFA
ncbi:MAG TPA: triose-phosphate isomerase [Candidatus Limnocylindria bacterium]|nr:triose-phosphate isomerase [Candidatus Limnocylindria bacterium]